MNPMDRERKFRRTIMKKLVSLSSSLAGFAVTIGVLMAGSGSSSGAEFPPLVVIDSTTVDPAQKLLDVLANSTNETQTVELCDIDLNLTGHSGIVLGFNRSLVASPDCARGPRHFGPRIYVTDQRGSAALFEIRGDNVRVSGFRLEGPDSGIRSDDNSAKGISIFPFGWLTDPIHNIEISNMEIYHWSGAGVEVKDNQTMKERGLLFNTNEGAVRIADSYLHHNRHTGLGYGVAVSWGAYALIEKNVFDENRHAIAGDSKSASGKDYSGYRARDNLILAGGGYACNYPGGFTFPWDLNCWQTHLIDMHGDENEWYSSHNWQCGTAGETMIIQRNTVLYTKGLAIKIRGNPADKAVIEENVFKHGSSSDAIAQNGNCGFGDNITNPIDVRPNNTFLDGVDPTAELWSCDFVGDGQEDRFMTTGVTWWALSPVTNEWRYLNRDSPVAGSRRATMRRVAAGDKPATARAEP
jgi:hypothetical protein